MLLGSEHIVCVSFSCPEPPANSPPWGCPCAPQVHASLIVVLTRGGSTARLVAKYRPSIPVLTVAVPVLTTDSLTWTCSGEQPVRQCLITRGLLPLLAEGSARATDTDTTDEIIAVRAPCCEGSSHAHTCSHGTWAVHTAM